MSRTAACRFEGIERFPGQRPTGVQKVSRQFQMVHFTFVHFAIFCIILHPESIGMLQRGSCAVVQVGAVTCHAEEDDVWFSDAIRSEWPLGENSSHTIGS